MFKKKHRLMGTQDNPPVEPTPAPPDAIRNDRIGELRDDTRKLKDKVGNLLFGRKSSS